MVVAGLGAPCPAFVGVIVAVRVFAAATVDSVVCVAWLSAVGVSPFCAFALAPVGVVAVDGEATVGCSFAPGVVLLAGALLLPVGVAAGVDAGISVPAMRLAVGVSNSGERRLGVGVNKPALSVAPTEGVAIGDGVMVGMLVVAVIGEAVAVTLAGPMASAVTGACGRTGAMTPVARQKNITTRAPAKTVLKAIPRTFISWAAAV